MKRLQVSIHRGLPLPDGCSTDDVHMIQGDYLYYHYLCDNQDDRGWGCGYRTLQTLCSWTKIQLETNGKDASPVPSIPEIQAALVDMEDKPSKFKSSRDWIGSVEVAMVVDYIYDVPCKILHIRHGSELSSHIEELVKHFDTKGSPIMMGGDHDAASKGIIGVCKTSHKTYLLVLDPHYYGPDASQAILVEKNMLIWRDIDSFDQDSFYNMCLPQLQVS